MINIHDVEPNFLVGRFGSDSASRETVQFRFSSAGIKLSVQTGLNRLPQCTFHFTLLMNSSRNLAETEITDSNGTLTIMGLLGPVVLHRFTLSSAKR